MIREINWSKKARNATAIFEPPFDAAEICRNGENNVEAN
jgi:hypothetical protein